MSGQRVSNQNDPRPDISGRRFRWYVDPSSNLFETRSADSRISHGGSGRPDGDSSTVDALRSAYNWTVVTVSAVGFITTIAFIVGEIVKR